MKKEEMIEATVETECAEFRMLLARLSTQINNGTIELSDDSRDKLNDLINTVRPFFNPLVRKL